MDTIGDFLTILRNASVVQKEKCCVSASKMRIQLAKVLKQCGFIRDYRVEEVRPGVKSLVVVLKYVKGKSAISGVVRCSRPGCRFYSNVLSIPRVLNNFGVCVLTTSKGVISGAEAVAQHIGGELICKVW